MALREGYVLDQAASALREGYVLDQASAALREGYDNILVTGARELSLKPPTDYEGRVNYAIPTPGITLPPARGGTAPYTYTASDLPTGLTFTAATRIAHRHANSGTCHERR